MSSLGPTAKYGGRRYILAATALLLVDFTYHDCDWYLISQIKKKMRTVKTSSGHTGKYFSEFSSKRVQQLIDSTKSQSDKINVVVGPSGAGKSTVLSELLYQKSSLTSPMERPTFIIRIGNTNNTGQCDDLASQILDSVCVPKRQSLLCMVRDGLGRLYNKVRDIHQDSAEIERLDYAFALLFYAIEEVYQQNAKQMIERHMYTRRHSKSTEIEDDFAPCRPVLVVDEGDYYPVTTPGHDQQRKALTRRFVKAAIQNATKQKNFETWLTGRDNALIEDICVKNKSTKYPITKFNTITLPDPDVDSVRTLFDALILYDPSGHDVKYETRSVDRVIEVLGTRVVDLMESRILVSFHTHEQLEAKLSEYVHKAEKSIQSLFDVCVSDEERKKLALILSQLSSPDPTEFDVTLNDLPASVRANKEAFGRVFFTAFGVVELQKPVIKYAWKRDLRACKAMINKRALAAGSGSTWIKSVFG